MSGTNGCGFLCLLLALAAPRVVALELADAPESGDQPAPAVPTNISPAAGLDEGEPGLVEFARRFSGHEPIYFVAGPKEPNVKFQFSFKYAILDPHGPLVERLPALAGVNLAYTQTSLWDVGSPSSPFFDSSYKPEVLWSDEYIPRLSAPGRFRVGLQAGLQHESNGKGGDDSRSLNVAYVRPIVTFGDVSAFHVTLSPRFFGYVGSLGDNPDIADYRGYADLRATAGWTRGLELAALGRIGNDWDKGSVQLDLTYPLNKLPLVRNVEAYLHVQAFHGYGESLLEYREQTTALRFGVALVR